MLQYVFIIHRLLFPVSLLDIFTVIQLSFELVIGFDQIFFV